MANSNLVLFCEFFNCFVLGQNSECHIQPETARRDLTAINYLFESESPFVWDEEKEYAKRVEQDAARGIDHSDKMRQEKSYVSMS